MPSYGWLVLCVGFVMHLCLGTLYCWGDLTSYATSYLRLHDPSITYSQTLYAYMASAAVQAFAMYPSGRLQHVLGQRLTAACGALLIVAAYMLASLTRGLGSFIVTYGALFGLGCGLVYTCPTTTAIAWLPQHKGLINGVITMGFGLGAFVFNFVITAYCNPDDLRQDVAAGGQEYFSAASGVPARVPGLLRLLAGIYAPVLFVGAALLRVPPLAAAAAVAADGAERAGAPPDGAPRERAGGAPSDETRLRPLAQPFLAAQQQPSEVEPSCNHGGGAAAAKHTAAARRGQPAELHEREWRPAEVVRSDKGWSMFFGAFFTVAGGLFVMGTYKSFGAKQEWQTDDYLALVGSLTSVGNALGRLAFGAACDRWGFLPVLHAMAAATALVIGTFSFSAPSRPAFTAWCVAIGFLLGGNFAIYPTGVIALFGRANFAANYGLVFLGIGCASIVVTVLNSALLAHVHYLGMTLISGGFAAVGLALSLYTRRAALRDARDFASASGSLLAGAEP